MKPHLIAGTYRVALVNRETGEVSKLPPVAEYKPRADSPADYAFRRGDTVIWHATFFDYEATVLEVLPATGFAPERLSLYVDTDYAPLKWVTVHASRCAIVLVEAAEALEAARATSA